MIAWKTRSEEIRSSWKAWHILILFSPVKLTQGISVVVCVLRCNYVRMVRAGALGFDMTERTSSSTVSWGRWRTVTSLFVCFLLTVKDFIPPKIKTEKQTKLQLTKTQTLKQNDTPKEIEERKAPSLARPSAISFTSHRIWLKEASICLEISCTSSTLSASLQGWIAFQEPHWIAFPDPILEEQSPVPGRHSEGDLWTMGCWVCVVIVQNLLQACSSSA